MIYTILAWINMSDQRKETQPEIICSQFLNKG